MRDEAAHEWGTLGPVADAVLEAHVKKIVAQAGNRRGHGIVPNTPVDQVLRVVDLIKRHRHTNARARNGATSDWAIRA